MINVRYTDGAVGVKQITQGILIDIDDNALRTKLILSDDMTARLIDELLLVLGEMTTDQIEEKMIGLEFCIEQLEEELEQSKLRYENLLNRYEKGVF